MNLRLELTKRAQRDLTTITAEGITRFGETLADAYLDGLALVFGELTKFPNMGKSRGGELRTLPHRSHVIVYDFDDTVLRILRVRHGREDWLTDLQDEP